MSLNKALEALMTETVAVPRGLLGAACYILRHSQHAQSKTAAAIRAYTYGEGIVDLPMGDVPDRSLDLAKALSAAGFMMTEPAPTSGFPKARRLVIGFQDGDAADAAMQAVAQFLRDYGAHRAEGGAA